MTITLGGFIEAAGIFRTRNEVADIASNFNTGIPFPQSVSNHETEFRGSGHQSRVSLLITGAIDQAQKLAAYYETDFQSAAPCQANTSGVVKGTVGAWWRFLLGGYGTAQVGAQYEYLRRSVFSGVGGGRGVDDNVVLQ